MEILIRRPLNPRAAHLSQMSTRAQGTLVTNPGKLSQMSIADATSRVRIGLHPSSYAAFTPPAYAQGTVATVYAGGAHVQ